MEDGKKFPIGYGKNNCVRVELPDGYEGKIVVEFIEPWYWRAAELVSLAFGIGLAVFFIRKRILRTRGIPKKGEDMGIVI